MNYHYRNLVLSGGGVLGIAYFGVLEYFYKIHLMDSFINLAGTSAGAITACIASFNLPFDELLAIGNSLDYKKITMKSNKEAVEEDLRLIPPNITQQFSGIFDNFDCVYRLVKSFGWYSSDYFYDWIKGQIANQFDATQKSPPYTFADFKNTAIHRNQRPFKNLYIVGTDMNRSATTIFSYETTPNMEVAEAVKISMSVPLLFEAVPSSLDVSVSTPTSLYADGGLLNNFPITLFDKHYPLRETLGICFHSTPAPSQIHNLVDFISHALGCTSNIQKQLFACNPKNTKRSMFIHTGDVSPLNFNVTTNDETYKFLYEHGYRAAELFFSS